MYACTQLASVDPFCVRACALRYLHKVHDFYDLDDEVEELNETIADGLPTSSDRSVVTDSGQSVRSEGVLGEGEYDY